MLIGPPCPDYSVANSHRKVGGSRNSMVALFLAYVDYYRPKYALMENVVGLIHHKVIRSTPSQEHLLNSCKLEVLEQALEATESGIENGTIK